MATQLAKQGIIYFQILNKKDFATNLSQTETLLFYNELQTLKYAELFDCKIFASEIPYTIILL